MHLERWVRLDQVKKEITFKEKQERIRSRKTVTSSRDGQHLRNLLLGFQRTGIMKKRRCVTDVVP